MRRCIIGDDIVGISNLCACLQKGLLLLLLKVAVQIRDALFRKIELFVILPSLAFPGLKGKQATHG